MEYGINVRFFEKTLPLEKSAELAAKAGFTQVDFTPRLRSDEWEKDVQDATRIFAHYGLTVHQTHAPFNRYGSYGKYNEGFHALCLERCAAATEMLGARYMVAHGDEFDFENNTFTPEAALDYNRSLFLPYVERAERNGYKVAFETVFEDWDRRRYTSKADELMGLIASFESPAAVCCWDFGHANVSFRNKAPDVIRRFGSLIECTHLHDNTGMDSHQMPLTGDIDWQTTMAAFHDIDYKGVLSVEYSHGIIPTHLAEDFISLTYKAAKHLWEL